MGKTGKWLRNFLIGKKPFKKEKPDNAGDDHRRPTTPVSVLPPSTPREKRRWSFRRPSASSRSQDCSDPTVENHDAKKHALAAATAAAADAAVAAAKAAAVVIQLTASVRGCVTEEAAAAAVKIQSCFRAYLARKALNALRGLVKLQALVRGHLVRKQATATLRCMQALITVQARARAQRLRMAAAAEIKALDHKHANPRKSIQDNNRYRNSQMDHERGLEENIKIVEMDLAAYKSDTKARNSCSTHGQQQQQQEQKTISTPKSSVKKESYQSASPVPSAMAEFSPRTCSNHYEEYSLGTAQSSPQCYSAMSAKPDPGRIPFSYARSEYGESGYNEYQYYPNYMSNTESSRAKVRSHSAPKSRPAEAFDRQTSRRRPSLEGRNVPRAGRMQRSSSQVSSAAQNYQQQHTSSIKLDKSSASIKDSECGSTSTYRSLVGYEVSNSRIISYRRKYGTASLLLLCSDFQVHGTTGF
ncbi:hypothetical protein M569_07568 [Genlisea aurea]|uniref:DUF4005 domain-containing protein n=1 Tax=Genlisea aurea TaxID=192259 RepID=S8E4G2_9LAMI|nr:hypothetical protein M569_07568 [Genlisea aurea]